MIFDKIENAALYQSIHPLIKKAFDYLKQTDFSAMPEGKYPVDGDNVFALVQEYETINNADAKLEAHRKYIDVQYVVAGEELIGVQPLISQVPAKEYDDADDYALYDDTCSFIKVNATQFAVLFPHDLHKPCIMVKNAAKVKKVVMKVRV